MSHFLQPLGAFLILGSLTYSIPTAVAQSGYAVYESQSSFDDVLAAARLAIEERGMYINNVMHLSDMLERTGKDLGQEHQTYQRAESIEFCSAVLSRDMTTENPARLVNCPFILSVYSLTIKPGSVFVAHREIPPDEVASSPVMARIAGMLKEIAGTAANW